MTEPGTVKTQIRSLTISDGTKIPLDPGSVVLLVGPNNAGKSRSLRDIEGRLSNPDSYTSRTVMEVDLLKQGTSDDFDRWISVNPGLTQDADGIAALDIPRRGLTQIRFIPQYWEMPFLQVISPFFLFHADARSRLDAGASVSNVDFSQQAASLPLQKAYRDPELERILREASNAAFALPVSVDRYGGTHISLRVGVPPEFEHKNGAPTKEYLDAISALPTLESQGDGMKSYMGLLLHILAGAHQITLVDEPEAFLHPPQARLLGQTLADRSVDTHQLFMATHSNDVVQGVLDSRAQVTIVRITREGDVNKAAVLKPEEVRSLWNDPLLRYSNLLEGLFHDAVVLCEGDADCRYYSSVLDSVYESGELTNDQRRPQLLFSHCGGKGRISSVAASLKAISIPVVAVVDFDVLNNRDLLSKTVESLGGDFSVMERDWKILNGALTSKTKPLRTVSARDAVIKAFDEHHGETLTKKEAERIASVLKAETGWDAVKAAGIGGVPQGEPSESAHRLLKNLKRVGLLVVPVGEIERFVPTVPGHGPQWVTEVHKQGLHTDQRFTQARDFVKDINSAALAVSDLRPTD